MLNCVKERLAALVKVYSNLKLVTIDLSEKVPYRIYIDLHRKLLIRSNTLQCQALGPFTKGWNHLKLRQFNGYSGYMYCRNKLDRKSLKLMGSSSDCKTYGEGSSYKICCACWIFTRNLVINCNDCQGWWQSASALPRSLWLEGWKCSVSIVLVLNRPTTGWFPS